MIDSKKIIEKVQSGLKNCSELYGIEPTNVRILISSAGVHLWNADKYVSPVDVLQIFKVSKMENYLFPIVPFLKKALVKVAVKKEIVPETAVARIYTNNDGFYPSVCLQDVLKEVGEISIDELLN